MVFSHASSVALLGLTTILTLGVNSNTIIPREETINFNGPITIEAKGMANIHITYRLPLSGKLSIHYGSCDSTATYQKELHHHMLGETVVGDHYLAKKHTGWQFSRPERFVWLIPENTVNGGCLFAYSDEILVGRSDRVSVVKRQQKRGFTLADVADSEGPWCKSTYTL
jgi:hypothetical protein